MTDRRSLDKLLPLVLFAYHEVPQEATGFSPFKLIYSRDVRGLLDILCRYPCHYHSSKSEKCTTAGTRTSEARSTETENMV